jgi:hypothetical protein
VRFSRVFSRFLGVFDRKMVKIEVFYVKMVFFDGKMGVFDGKYKYVPFFYCVFFLPTPFKFFNIVVIFTFR